MCSVVSSARACTPGLDSGDRISWVEAFETPLGRIPLAVKQIRELLRFPEVQLRDDAHLEEHCLEVQLPFLQELLGISI